MVENKLKQAEMDAIPINWKINSLGKVMDVFRGGSPRPIQEYITTSKNGVNWIKIGDVGAGAKYIDRTDEKIIPEGVLYSRTVNVGDLLLSNSMSFGRPYILRTNGCIHDGWLVLQNYHDTFTQEFLFYILSSNFVLNQYKSKAAGSSVLNLNKELVASVKLLIPPIEEQKAIAKVLSELDDYIDKLSRQIKKKQVIRDGMLEDLVRGKRRLPGYDGEWKEYDFISLINPKARIGWQGLKKSEYLKSGYALLIAGTDFDDGLLNYSNMSYVSQERYEMDENIHVKNNDVLVTKDGTIGKVAIVKNLSMPATLNSGVFVFKVISEKLTQDFLYYILRSSVFEDFIDELSAGSTIKHLYQKDLKNLYFKIPVDINEQKAITDFIQSMDTELDLLKQKRAKYTSIKQGVMEELLTGKTCLND
ncbi:MULTISPECIES: restriction endonuclease subunit S [Enterococcus]|jgi:type I restriction enzyme S subunit|uniref:restriction endonuclease subunit S n=1 Tax=Enterococcus TaxID=1350 RepID=UPI000BBC139D|nr:restriction endonuclease subunit S [Enterococcus faecium]HIZ17445.1 restriction endonuclease subunit S [Bacillota bacterium]EGP4887954.1 restriction endonuclease subunit S [Enterococcus faecium]EGP5092599.1 restriction endonuclease subunit S [Enterococcus faecium]EGP5131005.1 restriction endonuclease subunit S [Enterococcus faecium]EGP5649528.1 restriction endonuclease subunit S [Enterococcus faecium]